MVSITDYRLPITDYRLPITDHKKLMPTDETLARDVSLVTESTIGIRNED